jgi:response regulator RpfG family c-di-GMP phosphodiesterase
VNEESLLLDPSLSAGRARTILLVDGRDRVRAQLHKFFESAGYNLLEASDREEASALGQVHEGPLDLLIAEAQDCEPILSELHAKHPGLECLTLVDVPESSLNEIRRPFTQQELLQRTTTLFERKDAAGVPVETPVPTE